MPTLAGEKVIVVNIPESSDSALHDSSYTEFNCSTEISIFNPLFTPSSKNGFLHLTKRRAMHTFQVFWKGTKTKWTQGKEKYIAANVFETSVPSMTSQRGHNQKT